MFWRKRQPLLHCEIVHALPGRARIRCRALRYLAAYAAEIRQRLQDLSPIRQARVNFLTQNVLLHYDHTQVSVEDVLELTELVIGSYSLTAYKAERAEQNRPTVNERRLQEGSLSEMLTRIGVTTATLVFYFFRKPADNGPGTLAGRFLTVPSLTAASLALPIFRSGLSSLATTFRPNADTLSSTAIVASIASGRGLSALTIIWLADIAELLTAYTMRRTRRRDPQHALGGRRDRLAAARRRRRGARGPRSTPPRRPHHGPHRREDQRGRGGRGGRGGGRPGLDHRRIHAAGQGRRRPGVRRNGRQERPAGDPGSEGRRPDRRGPHRPHGRGGHAPQGQRPDHRRPLLGPVHSGQFPAGLGRLPGDAPAAAAR